MGRRVETRYESNIGGTESTTQFSWGLVDYGLRFYQPKHGRFINRDPIGEAGGLNLYEAFLGDPLNRWDFLGLDSAVIISRDGANNRGHTAVLIQFVNHGWIYGSFRSAEGTAIGPGELEMYFIPGDITNSFALLSNGIETANYARPYQSALYYTHSRRADFQMIENLFAWDGRGYNAMIRNCDHCSVNVVFRYRKYERNPNDNFDSAENQASANDRFNFANWDLPDARDIPLSRINQITFEDTNGDGTFNMITIELEDGSTISETVGNGNGESRRREGSGSRRRPVTPGNENDNEEEADAS